MRRTRSGTARRTCPSRACRRGEGDHQHLRGARWARGLQPGNQSERLRVCVDPETGDVVGETIEEQTRQCLRNVEAILQAAGSTIDDVVQATFILLDESDFAGMNEEWSRWVAANPPARQGAKRPNRPKSRRISIAAVAVA